MSNNSSLTTDSLNKSFFDTHPEPDDIIKNITYDVANVLLSDVFVKELKQYSVNHVYYRSSEKIFIISDESILFYAYADAFNFDKLQSIFGVSFESIAITRKDITDNGKLIGYLIIVS